MTDKNVGPEGRRDRPFDPSKPVTTRDGRPARIVCTDRKGSPGDALILALVENEGGVEHSYWYHINGAHYGAPRNNLDLVNVVAKTSTYQNVYAEKQRNRGHVGGNEFNSKENALRVNLGEARLGFIRRDYEDGVLVKTELENL